MKRRSDYLSVKGKTLTRAAQIIGHLGGLKGGPARAAKMTAEERSESARNAVKARWERYRQAKAAVTNRVG